MDNPATRVQKWKSSALSTNFFIETFSVLSSDGCTRFDLGRIQFSYLFILILMTAQENTFINI